MPARRGADRNTPASFLKLMQEHLPEVANHYEGEAIFVPISRKYAEVLGYAASRMYPGSLSYEEKVETVTGLKVIHKGGLVVGNPDLLDKEFALPELPKPTRIYKNHDRIESVMQKVEHLSPEEKEILIARLAIDSTE